MKMVVRPNPPSIRNRTNGMLRTMSENNTTCPKCAHPLPSPATCTECGMVCDVQTVRQFERSIGLWRRLLVLVIAMVVCLICVLTVHQNSDRWLTLFANLSQASDKNLDVLSALQSAVIDHALTSGDRSLLFRSQQLPTRVPVPTVPLWRLENTVRVSEIAQIVICVPIGLALALTTIAFFRRTEPLSRRSVNIFMTTTVALLVVCLMTCIALLPSLQAI